MISVTTPRLGDIEAGRLISTEDHVLRVFLSYSHLPLQQLARILAAIEGVFDAVIMTAVDPSTTAIQLCVVEAHTGQSIDFKFGGRVPWAKFKKNGDVEFWFPKWTAALALASTLIIGADESLKHGRDLLEAFAPHEDTQQVQPPFAHDRLRDPDDLAGRSARYHLLLLNQEFDAANMHRVDVNGVIVRPKNRELHRLPGGDFKL